MAQIHCTNCFDLYPHTGTPYKCARCGGTFDYLEFPAYSPELEAGLPGIWRYQKSIGLEESARIISLGEGQTPLIWAEAYDQQVAFKCEYLNPTGSYKDRGAAVLLSFLCSRGVTEAVEDSSGNAGAAFAAYAARAGVKARIYIPDSTSGPKRKQIESYGANLIRILGSRSVVAEKAREAADSGIVYASHAYLPQGLPGYATIAYEIYNELGRMPGTVVAPVGQGNLLVSLGRGFEQIQASLNEQNRPVLIGVQALACAPIWAVFNYGAAGLGWVSEAPTLAEGVRVRHPVRGDTVLRMVEASGGIFLAINEQAILRGRNELSRRGFYVEPTSAIVWEALEQVVGNFPEPVVVILTGSGLKSSD
jgi:threonine synthase